MDHSLNAPIRRLGAGILAFGALVGAAGCETVEQDKFFYEGGNSPDPAAMVEGTVTYSGPRPQCAYNPDGSFDRIKGNVILTLFEYDNPPAPEGTATSSLNLLVVPGDKLFLEADCRLPEGERLARSADFLWPRLPLYLGTPKAYQVRGFYDYDEDFIPFFAATRIPTAGDVIGAGLRDVRNPAAGLARIDLPALELAKSGYVHRGVTVMLAEQVWSERPVFRLDGNNRLAANAAFMPALAPNGLSTFRSLTCAAGAETPDCGLTLQRLGAEEAPKLASVGIELDLDNPARYAFYAEPVDVTTVVPGGFDLRGADGKVDPHPFLNGLGYDWYTPMLVLQRILSPEEIRYKIPRVVMVGSVLMKPDTASTAAVPTKKSYTDGVPMAVAPVAAVELKADDARCRVPYFAPGTPSIVLGNRVAHCAELPTGRYAVNVLGGVAGGTGTPNEDRSLHESGLAITGGRYSGQSWSIPNELALEAQVGAENVMAHQGVDGTFIVQDPSPEAQGECTTGTLLGRCEGEYQIGAADIDSAACLPSYCCAEVSHLYEQPLPRCPMGADGISTLPTSSVGTGSNGQPIPNCLPFDLPAQCRP